MCGNSPSQQTASASAKQEARGVHKVAAKPAGNKINNKNRREVLERKSHVSKFTLPERKQQKWGRREEGEEGTETLLLPFGLISRGCRGIKHIPYNSIRETSIKAATLMCRNTTCVRNRHYPLIKASQLARTAAPRHSHSPNTEGVCCVCRGRAGSFQGFQITQDLSLLTRLLWFLYL